MSRALPRIEAPFLRDPALQAVLGAIGAGGHRALIVGGAVRNALLGAPVADVDIATDARPDQVIALARAAGLRSVPTGIAHGTVTVISDGRGFEVTTFRRDVETDGRRAVVAFSDDLAQDAARRDFTMNALYAEPGGQVIDPVGGLDDLRARRLAFVGAPEARIREDYLRILRFFRFLAWYGRDAEPQALAACTELRAGLTQISAERITAELMRLLAAPDPSEALDLMAQSGVLAQVLPGADNRAIAALVEAEQEHEAPPNEARRAERRLAALGQGLHEALRLPKAAQTRLAKLGKAQEAPDPGALGYHMGAETGYDAALVALARGAALPGDWERDIAKGAGSPLPVSAGDLGGIAPGPAIGAGLRAAERLWLASGFAASRGDLIAAAQDAAKEAER